MSESDIIKNGSLKERLVAVCDQITTFFGWSLEKETEDWEKKGSRRITQTEDLRKTTYKAKLEADINYGLGISTLYDRIPTPDSWGAGWRDLFGYSTADDFTVDEIENQRVFAYIILDIIRLYNDWKKEEFDPMISGIGKKIKSKKGFKVDTAILEAINKLVVNGRFKAYMYKDGGDRIHADNEYHISDVIGFSKDLTMWLTHVQNQDEFLSKQADNKVFITMFGKMDEVHPIYSNWLFTLHKGKTIWIVTDQVEFDNPYQKHARLERRSAWRDADDHYSDCDLPFDLFHEIDKLKGPDNKLVKNDSFIREPFVDFDKVLEEKYNSSFDIRDNAIEIRKMFEAMLREKLDKLGVEFDCIIIEDRESSHNWFNGVDGMYVKREGHTVAYAQSGEIIIYKRAEVFFKQFSELTSGQQTFSVLLMKEIVQYLGAEVELEPIMLASEHTNMKLLEGAKISPTNPAHMEYWNIENKKIFKELIETLESGEEKTTALTIASYDVVKKSTSYNASWLSTPAKLESLAEWSIIDDEKKKLYPKLKELSESREDGLKWLNRQISERYEIIVKNITTAKEIRLLGRASKDGFSTRMEYAVCGRVSELKNKNKKNDKQCTGIGKERVGEQECIECRKIRLEPKLSKPVKIVHIRHYRELVWMLGLENRMQLHRYFQNYRTHDMIPYTGNSILDQTHPYLRVYDPCSNYESNGMSFELFMCGYCYSKINQQEKTEIRL